jgi:hypothetical protein
VRLCFCRRPCQTRKLLLPKHNQAPFNNSDCNSSSGRGAGPGDNKKVRDEGTDEQSQGFVCPAAFLEEHSTCCIPLWEEEDLIVAKHTPTTPSFPGPHIKELGHIPTYHRLLQYHRKCSITLRFQCDDCVYHSPLWPLSDGKIYEVYTSCSSSSES